MRRTSVVLQGLALVIGCLVLSGNALAQAPSAIQIFMPNGGMPSRAIALVIVRDDGTRDLVYTDSSGKYRVPTPRNQSVHYSVTIAGDSQTFATTVASFTIDRSSPNQMNVFLNPLLAERRPTDAVLDVATFEGSVPAKARTAYKRAMDSISNGQLENAASNLQQAITLYPQYVRALNDLGVVYLKLDRLDEAAATLRQAIEINKRFFHPRMNLGIVLTRQGKYREALEILEPLCNENRGMLEVRLAYTKALEGAGEFANAAKLYRATLESKNLSTKARAEMRLRLGVIANRQGKFAEAAANLEEAIALDETAKAHLHLGLALMQLQQPEKAERELLRAYELAGNSAGAAQLMLGHIYYKQRRFAESQRAFEQYLKDVPYAPDVSEITQLIAELKTKKN